MEISGDSTFQMSHGMPISLSILGQSKQEGSVAGAGGRLQGHKGQTALEWTFKEEIPGLTEGWVLVGEKRRRRLMSLTPKFGSLWGGPEER